MCLAAVERGIGNETRNGLPVTRNHDLFTRFHEVQQLPEIVLAVKGAKLPHGIFRIN
jgi:hypothetical protein